MKKILFIFVIVFITSVKSFGNIITIATVDNISITNKDLEVEILILKTLNNFKKIDQNELKSSAFQNLIRQAIKEIAINYHKNKIADKANNQVYLNIKKKLTENGVNSPEIHRNIKKKSQVEYAWNLLISKTYSWKLNVNMNEINQRLLALGYIDPKNLETIKAKTDLIAQEKNKKFNFYSRNHLDLIKKKLLIKIMQ